MRNLGQADPILIRGGRVIDPAQGLDAELDVLLAEGVVKALGQGLDAAGGGVIEARGLWVTPGLIDLRAHLREPGEEWKEDLASGTRAAAAGGFAAVCALPDTKPPVDNAAMVRSLRQLAAEKAVVRVLPVGAVTKGREGKELAELGEMAEAGAVAFSDGDQPLADAEVMRCALEYGRAFGKPLLSHCQEPSLTREAVVHLGYTSTVLGLRGMPAAAEEIMVAREVILARHTQGRVHIAHVSAGGTVKILRLARAEGIPVTADVTPAHLCLTEALVRELAYDTNTKVNPPLRSEEDVTALRQAVADGTIGVIATGHAPQHRDDKEVEYHYAAFGISMLETAVPLLLTELVHRGLLSPATLIERLTVGPARVLSLPAGTLRVGSPADLTLIDPQGEKAVDPERFYSRGKNTPLAGWRLKGWPVLTIVAGRVVMRDGQVLY